MQVNMLTYLTPRSTSSRGLVFLTYPEVLWRVVLYMYYLKFSISICITVVCSVNGGNSVEHTEKKNPPTAYYAGFNF